ncbi:MAG: mechanosensitive ion channel, partial [Treponema sp.]|nr:mechanosensitive ion channel [Treponema sp.]
MFEKCLVFWNTYQGNILSFCHNILITLIIIFAGRFAVWILNKLIRHAESGPFQIDKALISLLTAVVNYGVIIVCIIMILDAFGVNTNSLIAILGAAGVAVGLALKDTLSNIAAG